MKSTDRDDVQKCYDRLSAMDKPTEIGNPRSLIQIIQRLPVFLLIQWRKKARCLFVNIDIIHFEDVIDVMKEAAGVNDPEFSNIVYGKRDIYKT